MCCIIYRPKGAKEISDWKLKAIIDVNPDGWGLSYIKDNVLQVVKSCKMQEAIARIRSLEKEDIEFLFHARFATHGDKTIENCHPFKLSNKGLLFHNGKIDIHCRTKKLSDTYYFSLRVNKYLRRGRSIESIVKTFSKMIGESRLAYMSQKGQVVRFGKWHELDGCFYSKLNWKWESIRNYSGWEGYGGYQVNDKRRVLSPANKVSKDEFLDTIAKCKKGGRLYIYDVKYLTDQELTILAKHFPKVCAEYLSRTCV